MAIVFTLEGQEQVGKWLQGDGPSPTDQMILYLLGDEDAVIDPDTTKAYLDALPVASPDNDVWTYGDNGAPTLDEGVYRVHLRDGASIFNFSSAGGKICGWYVVDQASDTVLWAKKYDTPIDIVAGLMHTIDLNAIVVASI